MADSTLTAERVSAPSDSSPDFPITAICMALIGVSVLIKAWAAFGSWFYEDDFVFLSTIARGENDLDWYLTRHNVHFMPLSLLIATPVGLLGGFAWWAAALELTVMYTLGALACWWMLRRLFGQNPRIIAPLAFYVFSPLLIPAITWWAAGLNIIAIQAPLFVLIGSHVTYLRTRQHRWLAVAGLMLVLMSGIYVKSLVALAVLGLFTVCYATQGPNPARRFLATVTRWWKAWAVYTVVAVVTLSVYIRQGEASAPGGETAGASQAAENLLLRNLIPSLVGGPWSWADMGGWPRQLANPSDLMVAVALTAVVGAVAYSIHRWQNAWLPLVFLAPPVIATFLAIGAFRTSSFPFLSLETRYWADLLPYLVLAFAVTVMRVQGLPEVRRPRVEHAPGPSTPLILGIGAAYVLSSLMSTLAYIEPWHTNFPAKRFVTGAIAASDEAGTELEVADVAAPAYVMSSTFYPDNTPGRLFAPVPGRFNAVDSGVDLLMLDAQGLPARARAEGAIDEDLSQSQCIDGTGRIKLPARTFDFPFWVTMRASFDLATTLYVTAGDARHGIEVPEGRHEVTFRTTGSYRYIDVSTRNDATLCPESVRIGTALETR